MKTLLMLPLLLSTITVAVASTSDDGSGDIDTREANASTGLHETARQMRRLSEQCRDQARQAQMNSRQMAMFASSYADAAMIMSVNNMGQIALQFAMLYDQMADRWEKLDEAEKEYFAEMERSSSRKERTAIFVRTKNKLNRLIDAGNSEGAWELYVTVRRSIMAFRRSIAQEQDAEAWIQAQDLFYMQRAIQQQDNLRQSAMNTAMQAFAASNKSFSRSLDASRLPSRRCGACNKEYYGYGGCPQCSGPNYGLNSNLIEDKNNPQEKVRVFW